MELIEKLKKLTDGGIKIRDIEEQVGFPKNNLSNILAGKKELPLKWRAALESFVAAKEESMEAAMITPEQWEKELNDEISKNKKLIWSSMITFNMVVWHIDENGNRRLIDPMGDEMQKLIASETPKQFKNDIEKKLWEIQQERLKNKK